MQFRGVHETLRCKLFNYNYFLSFTNTELKEKKKAPFCKKEKKKRWGICSWRSPRSLTLIELFLLSRPRDASSLNTNNRYRTLHVFLYYYIYFSFRPFLCVYWYFANLFSLYSFVLDFKIWERQNLRTLRNQNNKKPLDRETQSKLGFPLMKQQKKQNL